ncbi:peptidoglycan editing factor PgeF [Vibrio pectenicida]|uniref:Purine nucleoside phosphorylase n=1 Tax=Vibrio pectenicida TaxID=62763 RepID=A0A427U0D2_9VIBR|nr:peptidoglycan editing factor PgeF [Vibrio pectenicida]RSD29970.1 peptidoglycan editing factor PgeF [Vibrio pectenicida]
MEMIIPNWPAPARVRSFSSTRNQGFSSGTYRGLNLGGHVGDDATDVKNNRRWLVENSSMPTTPIWLNQTHSTTVTEVAESNDVTLNADGLFTREAGLVCSVMTADCLPVLLSNASGSQIAAVHAGWRGLASGIIEQAVAKFQGQVMAWIGPAIGATAFEVGEDVFEAFVSIDPSATNAFKRIGMSGKWLADMNMLATQRLNKVGVLDVYYSDMCTYADPERFFSYRRDGVTGRQATFIWIEK